MPATLAAPPTGTTLDLPDYRDLSRLFSFLDVLLCVRFGTEVLAESLKVAILLYLESAYAAEISSKHAYSET